MLQFSHEVLQMKSAVDLKNVFKTDRTLLDGKRIFNRFVALITRDLEIIHGDPGF